MLLDFSQWVQKLPPKKYLDFLPCVTITITVVGNETHARDWDLRVSSVGPQRTRWTSGRASLTWACWAKWWPTSARSWWSCWTACSSAGRPLPSRTRVRNNANVHCRNRPCAGLEAWMRNQRETNRKKESADGGKTQHQKALRRQTVVFWLHDSSSYKSWIGSSVPTDPSDPLIDLPPRSQIPVWWRWRCSVTSPKCSACSTRSRTRWTRGGTRRIPARRKSSARWPVSTEHKQGSSTLTTSTCTNYSGFCL